MKKIYASLAVAAAVSAQAFGAVDMEKSTLYTRASEVIQGTGITAVENTDGRMKAPATADQNGNQSFSWQYYSLRSDLSGLQTGGLYVAIEGTEATLYGVFDLAPVKGTFNAAAGTIRIESQPLFYTYQGEQIYLYTKRLVIEDDKITGTPDVPYIEFTYMPDGAELSNGSVICKGGWIAPDDMEFCITVPSMKDGSSGFNWTYMMRLMTIEEAFGFPFFKYDASEWTDCDDASLEDGWFKALDGKGYPAYNVACKKSKTNPGEILLVNPYGQNSPYKSMNASSNKDGYIVLNIENPDCILVRPYVNASFDMSNFYQEPSLNNPIFATSSEGWRYYTEGWTFDDIIEDAEMFGDPIATMTTDGVVTIPNARIQGDMADYTLASQWEAEGGIPIEMISTIRLPKNALGVEGVINDAENVPARYFNLQGVELSNPEAGQVVIVKQGSKSFKTIAK